MGDILEGLNPDQRAAVTSDSSVLQVLAPPGSGKTKTLTARVAHLIAHKDLRPWNIITCTFTKKAANEMKDRIRNFVGEECAKRIRLGTFHAIAVQYLRQYGQHIGLAKDFGIADSSDSKAILKRIVKRNEFTLEPGTALSRISAKKVRDVDSEYLVRTAKSAEQQEFAQIFSEYEAELKASNLLDYDDLLLRCCVLMKNHPECVSNVEAVLIDEFQDTNNIQYDLMALFAQRRNAITIVGDPDQSIYGFRNAEIKNLARMKEQWPDTLTINLKENYRSSGAILHAAQNIIEQDESRPPKKLQATHSPGLRPVLRKLPSSANEATWLVSEIERMCALSGQVLNHSDFAILLRSANLSREIEGALNRASVSYSVLNGTKFFERAEIKLILDYLRVIHQPDNNEAVERIINVPARRLGAETVKALHAEASSKDMRFWRFVCDIAQGRRGSKTKLNTAAAKGLSSFVDVILSGRKKAFSSESGLVSLVDLINLVAKKIDLQGYLKHKYENEHEARWSNVEELMAQAADVSDPERLKSIVEEDTLPTIDGLDQRSLTAEDALSIFLANVTLSTTTEKENSEDSEPVQQVTISTIHSAKGLEWPVVFIPACFDGSIPHSRADDNDEERRLLYVGMTRAQAMLYLSCPLKNTQREETTMSSFLTQPGVSRFFEEHGPSMSLTSASALALTLRREPPTDSSFDQGKNGLELDEDNYWPLTGEEPAAERAKWDAGKADNLLPGFGTTRPANWVTSTSVTTQNQQGFSTASAMMSSGFVSVKDRYDELAEQERLKAIDKRAADSNKKSTTEAPKGRKRQIEGQGTISNFFSKRRQPSPEATRGSNGAPSQSADGLSMPLQDISNLNSNTNPYPLPVKSSNSTARKPRTVPLKQTTSSSQSLALDNAYLFLSSSPPRPEVDENELPNPVTNGGLGDDADTMDSVQSRPAATFHTTLMQSMPNAAQRGKRYGVRPSFNGWANRGRR